MSPQNEDNFALGACVGRTQALGLIANHCSAAQAKCLQQMRDSGRYKSSGLNWGDFCQQRIGLSRQRVDVIISNLEAFGSTYFQLSQIIPVSPEIYQQISAKIEGEEIEIDGQKVAIAPENAARIRNAVQQLRADLKKSRVEAEEIAKTRENRSRYLMELHSRNCDALNNMWDLVHCGRLSPEDVERLPKLLEIATYKIDRIIEEIERWK